MRFALPCLVIALTAGPAERLAAAEPQPLAAEPRIRAVTYDGDQVVQLKAYLGYQLMLEFAPGEHIENVAIGDATSWQVTPNRRADLLFIKPLAPFTKTNMTVVTDLRRYALELSAADDPAQASLAYIVRYKYPEAAPTTVATAPARPPNTAYSVKGARSLKPAEVFDNGRFTYFKWADGAPQPAIFVVSTDGQENLANSGTEGGYVIVEQIASRFMLRIGKQTAVVLNRGLQRAENR